MDKLIKDMYIGACVHIDHPLDCCGLGCDACDHCYCQLCPEWMHCYDCSRDCPDWIKKEIGLSE